MVHSFKESRKSFSLKVEYTECVQLQNYDQNIPMSHSLNLGALSLSEIHIRVGTLIILKLFLFIVSKNI